MEVPGKGDSTSSPSVGDFMVKDVSCCELQDSSATAARLMWRRDCGSVPVVDSAGRLSGIVTDRDLCLMGMIHRLPLHEIPVASVMTRDVATVHPEEPVSVAEELMRERQVHRLPVVDDGGRVVGILSLHDLAHGRTARGVPGLQAVATDEVGRVFASVSAPRVRPQAVRV